MVAKVKNKTKIYFWLKIDEHFFNNLVIKNLRTIASGDSYVVIYMRMMLESLKDNGVIYFENTMDTIFEEIALKLGENVNDVKATIGYFTKHGLIQIDEAQNAEMVQVPAILAQETNMARYQREHRERKRQGLTMSDQCQIVSKKGHTEIELELEKELEIELESEVEVESEQDQKPNATDFDFVTYYQSRIGALDGFQFERLNTFVTVDGFEPELLKIAIDKAADNGKRNFSYIQAILKSWAQNGIKTVVQQEEEQRQRDEAKANKHQVSQKQSNVPDWSNENYVNTTTDEEKAQLEEYKRQALERLNGNGDKT